MFRLLSKESNIFSIPVYIGVLLVIVISFNILDYNTLDIISAMITFLGVALGYFCFHAMALNYHTHLPLFLYTFFIFALYPGDLDIGIAVSLFTNAIILLQLTADNLSVRNNSYLLVGALLALNFIFLPTTWPMFIFVLFHIVATGTNIGRQLGQFFLGIVLVALSYFSIAYFLHLGSWDTAYFPFGKFTFTQNFGYLWWLSPILILLLHSVGDHFRFYNRKSPSSRFKYTFLLVYSVAQLITIVLYMGKTYEYLLLLALPASIILSRMLRFAKKYWVREAGLWLIIGCLLLFKLSSYFNFY